MPAYPMNRRSRSVARPVDWSPNCSCSVSSVVRPAHGECHHRQRSQLSPPRAHAPRNPPAEPDHTTAMAYTGTSSAAVVFVSSARTSQPTVSDHHTQRGPFERCQEGVNTGDLKPRSSSVVPDALRPEQMSGTEDEEHECGQRDFVSRKASDAPPRQPQRGDAGQCREQPRGVDGDARRREHAAEHPEVERKCAGK